MDNTQFNNLETANDLYSLIKDKANGKPAIDVLKSAEALYYKIVDLVNNSKDNNIIVATNIFVASHLKLLFSNNKKFKVEGNIMFGLSSIIQDDKNLRVAVSSLVSGMETQMYIYYRSTGATEVYEISTDFLMDINFFGFLTN